MKRTIAGRLLLAAVVFASVGCGREPADSAPSTPSPAVAPAPAATPRPPSFDVERAMDHVRALSVEIGIREAGTEGDRRASEYIAAEMSKLGWTVERRPFPLPQGGESWNVVAAPPGFEEDEPYLIVGGHYDSLRGPGANDNATGVGVAIEVGRSLDEHPARLPVVFVAFGAEEKQPLPGRHHHIGSRAYVAAMSPAARSNLRALVNLDMVGVGDTMLCPRMKTGPREGALRCVRRAVELGIPSRETVTPDWSDNGSFLREGLNASWLWSGDQPCCNHTPKDTIEKLQLSSVERAGLLSVAILRSYE
jgi:hypothetical protein